MSSSIVTISFILYGLFIFIAFVAVIALFFILKKDLIQLEKINKLIDFFKTVLYTTAFSAVGFIVANMFQERKQIIDELEYFDKYIAEVLQEDGDARLKLSKYFSIVTPSGVMKKSWGNYNKYLISQLREAEQKEKKYEKKSAIKDLSEEELLEREENRRKIAEFKNPISTRENTEWWIIAGSYRTVDEAKNEINKAIEINPNALIIKKDDAFVIVLKGYSNIRKPKNLLDEVREKINENAYMVKKDEWYDTIDIIE
jgi:tetratricopeptide (TPR) repeat protein